MESEGSQSFHLTSHLIQPLSIMSQMAGADPGEVEMELDKYFSIQGTRAKQAGEKELAGFYPGLSGIFMRHRQAAMEFHAPHASGLGTFFSRLEPTHVIRDDDGALLSAKPGEEVSPEAATTAVAPGASASVSAPGRGAGQLVEEGPTWSSGTA